jgi:hypothetical protein
MKPMAELKELDKFILEKISETKLPGLAIAVA